MTEHRSPESPVPELNAGAHSLCHTRTTGRFSLWTPANLAYLVRLRPPEFARTASYRGRGGNADSKKRQIARQLSRLLPTELLSRYPPQVNTTRQRLLVLVGHQGDKIRQHLDIPATFIETPECACTGSSFSLKLARDFVRAGFLYVNSDLQNAR